MIRKRYSQRTLQTYCYLVQKLLDVLNGKHADRLTDEDIGRYITKFYIKKGYSRSYQNQVINALKLYYRIEFDREIDQKGILRPRKDKKLPQILSPQEVRRFLITFVNEKHRTIFYLIYSAGLRISEVVHLTISDIDSDRNVIRIRNSKGAKDREVPLSETCLKQLRTYYKAYRPKKYLFEGQHGGAYSTRSIQQLFKRGIQKAGIRKAVTVHSLRHSYATHLLESGTDIRIIQELLGHKSSKTTEIYTHVSRQTKQRVPNPLDKLNL